MLDAAEPHRRVAASPHTMLACRALYTMSAFLLLLLALVAGAPPASAAGPTLAVEDTLFTEVPEVLVRAPRVTLDEILGRVARGEARRESLLTDQSFQVAVRLMRDVTGRAEPRLIDETVWRVYRKRPDKVRSLLLRRREDPKRKRRARAGVDIQFAPGMGEDIVNFAFKPEARRDYRYRIVGRDLVGGHVVYRIEFEPRSLLDPFAPNGRVWVDTNDFVIVREEMGFRRSPVPLVLKEIHRMVIERRRVGGFWVLSRVLMRVELTVPFPTLGRSFDMSLQYQHYRLNGGLEDALFEEGAKR